MVCPDPDYKRKDVQTLFVVAKNESFASILFFSTRKMMLEQSIFIHYFLYSKFIFLKIENKNQRQSRGEEIILYVYLFWHSYATERSATTHI